MPSPSGLVILLQVVRLLESNLGYRKTSVVHPFYLPSSAYFRTISIYWLPAVVGALCGSSLWRSNPKEALWETARLLFTVIAIFEQMRSAKIILLGWRPLQPGGLGLIYFEVTKLSVPILSIFLGQYPVRRTNREDKRMSSYCTRLMVPKKVMDWPGLELVTLRKIQALWRSGAHFLKPHRTGIGERISPPFFPNPGSYVCRNLAMEAAVITGVSSEFLHPVTVTVTP